MNPAIILASASPRRKDLLDQIGVRHHVLPVDVDESSLPGEAPLSLVKRLAIEKASAGLKQAHEQSFTLPVLAADTLVVLNKNALGKPRNQTEHFDMLRALSGTTHQVISAFCLRDEKKHYVESVITDVTFCSLSDNDISAYWQSGEPKDKAGGYAIQGYGAVFVKRISGSYTSVVGLPLFECAQALNQFGVKV